MRREFDMTRFTRITITALIVAVFFAACTPSTNGSGMLPATRQVQDSGGGLPPHPAPTP
jgi:hypothetical protein